MTKLSKKSLLGRVVSNDVVFRSMEALGIHVVPAGFYNPIPDTRLLTQDIWAPRPEVPGVDLRLDDQVLLLAELAPHLEEVSELIGNGGLNGFSLKNGRFGEIDSHMLYAFIARGRPRRIIEVGAGFSTRLMAGACSRHAPKCRITTIDPYPPAWIDEVCGVEVIKKPVQEVPLETFDDLGADDILFIDSSHVAKIGSDVCREVLHIVPGVKRGVLVHFHDVFLPSEYPQDWVKSARRFWNEQYLLQAFLAFNSCFQVEWASFAMNDLRADALRAAIPSYSGNSRPGSFWIRRTA